MGVLRVSRSDYFSLGFCKRIRESDRITAALAVLVVDSSVARLQTLVTGVGGRLFWPPELRRKVPTNLDLSKGQRKARDRVLSGMASVFLGHQLRSSPAGLATGVASARAEALLDWKCWPPEVAAYDRVARGRAVVSAAVVQVWNRLWRRRSCGAFIRCGRSWVQGWVWVRFIGPIPRSGLRFGSIFSVWTWIAVGLEEDVGMT